MWSALCGITQKNSNYSDIYLLISIEQKPPRAAKYGKIYPQDICFHDGIYYERL